MFNTEKNIVKAFITSLIIFLLTIFIPKINLHAATINKIFDNNNLNNEIALKAIRADNNLAVFTLELNEKFDGITNNFVHIAEENNNSKYNWQKKKLPAEIYLPLIITHNNKKVVIVSTDETFSKNKITIQNFDSFFSDNLTMSKELKLQNFLPAYYLNIKKPNISSLSKSLRNDIRYFWTGYDKNILNIWSKQNDRFISIDIDNLDVKNNKLPLSIENNNAEQKITNQILNFKDGIYYAFFDIDKTNNSNNYGIKHTVYYSYNGSNWHEASLENQFNTYEIFLDSLNIGDSLYQTSVSIDFDNFESTANVWKITDAFTPWSKMNIKIPGESHILSINKIADKYNMIILKPSSTFDKYELRYFIDNNFENFNYNTAIPEIAETVNPQYKSLFYINMVENNSDTPYLEKHSSYKLKDRKNKSENFKFELLKVE